MSKKKLLPDDALKAVVSQDSKGRPFLNLLMPNGEELPFVRVCSIESDYQAPFAEATLKILVDIRSIEKYVPDFAKKNPKGGKEKPIAKVTSVKQGPDGSISYTLKNMNDDEK